MTLSCGKVVHDDVKPAGSRCGARSCVLAVACGFYGLVGRADLATLAGVPARGHDTKETRHDHRPNRPRLRRLHGVAEPPAWLFRQPLLADPRRFRGLEFAAVGFHAVLLL